MIDIVRFVLFAFACVCSAHQSQTAILYAHFSDALGDDNLDFFLNHGGIVSKAQYHYVFIVSGSPSARASQALDAAHRERPQQVEWHVRENKGYDFCAWSEALYGPLPVRANLTHVDYFILINKSVRGPFFSRYLTQHMDWPELFTAQLMEQGVALSGTSVNCDNWKSDLHLQSMLLAFNATIKDTIARSHIQCWSDKDTVIRQGEIGFSRAIIRSGQRLASTMVAFGGRSIPNEDTGTICEGLRSRNPGHPDSTDPYYPNNAGGISLHPLEMIFFKTNRNVDPKVLSAYTTLYSRDIRDWGAPQDSWTRWIWWRWLWAS